MCDCNKANPNNYLENLISQYFKGSEVKFSRMYHKQLPQGSTAVVIDQSDEGAAGYLIHGITLSDSTAGTAAIKINGENFVNYVIPPNLANTFDIEHLHIGIAMTIGKANKVEGTLHYQFLSTTSKQQ